MIPSFLSISNSTGSPWQSHPNRRGTSYDGLFHVSDWFPTLARAAGIAEAKGGNPSIDGIDQWGAINGNETAETREDLILHFNMWSAGIEHAGKESFDDAKAPGDRDASPSWQGFRAGEGSPSTSQSTRWPACVVAGKEPAEDESTPLRLSFRPRNPKHALWARVGGGGGHRLEVSGCRLLTLDFCDPIDTVRAVEFARFEGRG